MSRDGQGNYTPPLNDVVAGDPIEASWANTTIDDISVALTDSLSRSGNGGMLASFKATDGLVNVPSITFNNETNSGIYRAGTGDYRLCVNGKDKARIRDVNGLAAFQVYDLGGTGTWQTLATAADLTSLTLATLLTQGNTTGATKIEVDNASGGIDLIDNAKIRFGAGDDLEIFHDGTNSIIREEVISSGGLLVEADKLILRSHTSTEKYIEATKDGAVDLYHDNSIKLATNSTGIEVTGEVEADAFSGTGSVSITDFIDDDTFATATATNVPTAESVKQYVTTQIGTADELSEVLANGNTTGGTDISLTGGSAITSTADVTLTPATDSGVVLQNSGANTVMKTSNQGIEVLGDSNSAGVYIGNDPDIDPNTNANAVRLTYNQTAKGALLEENVNDSGSNFSYAGRNQYFYTKNNTFSAEPTTTSSITASDTTIPVTSVAGVRATSSEPSPAIISDGVNSEEVLVTSKAVTADPAGTFTVVRAQATSTAYSFASGATVKFAQYRSFAAFGGASGGGLTTLSFYNAALNGDGEDTSPYREPDLEQSSMQVSAGSLKLGKSTARTSSSPQYSHSISLAGDASVGLIIFGNHLTSQFDKGRIEFGSSVEEVGNYLDPQSDAPLVSQNPKASFLESQTTFVQDRQFAGGVSQLPVIASTGQGLLKRVNITNGGVGWADTNIDFNGVSFLCTKGQIRTLYNTAPFPTVISGDISLMALGVYSVPMPNGDNRYNNKLTILSTSGTGDIASLNIGIDMTKEFTTTNAGTNNNQMVLNGGNGFVAGDTIDVRFTENTNVGSGDTVDMRFTLDAATSTTSPIGPSSSLGDITVGVTLASSVMTEVRPVDNNPYSGTNLNGNTWGFSGATKVKVGEEYQISTTFGLSTPATFTITEIHDGVKADNFTGSLLANVQTANESMADHIGEKTICTATTGTPTYTFPDVTADNVGNTWIVVNAGTVSLTCNRTTASNFSILAAGSDPTTATSVTIDKGGMAEFVVTAVNVITVFGAGVS